MWTRTLDYHAAVIPMLIWMAAAVAMTRKQHSGKLHNDSQSHITSQNLYIAAGDQFWILVICNSLYSVGAIWSRAFEAIKRHKSNK